MVMFQGLISSCAIFIVLIPLARCGSVVTVTEDEAVQLEFPYPCDIKKVTIQSANRHPFYNSAKPEYLNLPSYQLNRFSVTDKNCLVQVKINPVNRDDEATYICQAYKDRFIQSELTRIRLNVNHPPGNVSCIFSINDDAVTNWVPLQCEALVGSLTGGIYCYQDFKILPPQSKLVQIGETLNQIFWARKAYPVFCCSGSLARPKDMCECNDFVWDPCYKEKILNPCPVTTAGQGEITKDPAEKSEGYFFYDTVYPYTSMPNTNKSKSSTLLWVIGIANLILVTVLGIVTLHFCHVEKTNKKYLKKGRKSTQKYRLMT